MRHGDVFLKVFTSLFSKSDRRSNARSVGRSSQRAKFPYPSKAPPKGEFSPKAKSGEDRLRWVCFACEAGNRTSGGFPLYNKAKINFMSAFFFDTRGPKKKAWQKRNAAKGVSPLRRRPTLRALDRRRLLKKAGENFCADIAVKSPINQNLNKREDAPICNRVPPPADQALSDFHFFMMLNHAQKCILPVLLHHKFAKHINAESKSNP